jgi:prepilin-type N-terminal cleavage/methylation domain-containing protein/prepilin-type processing-associated H-X9-DG protein
MNINRPTAFSLIELLVVIGIIGLLAAFAVGMLSRARARNSGVNCASNLRQIGQALLLYSNDNRGAYPRTRASANGMMRVPTWGTGVAATQPFADNGPADNDVTAALFLLLRTQGITAEVFCCPSSNVEKGTFGGTTATSQDRSNFSDVKKNLSYSYHNPYPSDRAMGVLDNGYTCTTGAEFAVAADKNPGGEALLKLTDNSPVDAMRNGNSKNHDRDGQNILYSDGHVAWESNPFVGNNRDNIYTTADGNIAASSVDMNDSILLPADD